MNIKLKPIAIYTFLAITSLIAATITLKKILMASASIALKETASAVEKTTATTNEPVLLVSRLQSLISQFTIRTL